MAMKQFVFASAATALLLLQVSPLVDGAKNKDVVVDSDDVVLVGAGGGPSSSPFDGFKNDKFDKTSFTLPGASRGGAAGDDDAVVIDSDSSRPGDHAVFSSSSNDPNKAGFRNPKHINNCRDGAADDTDAVIIDVSLCLSAPKDQGKRSSCKGEETAFSYIPGANKCEPYTYLGSEGSSNRFPSQEKCIASCKNTVEEGCYHPAPDTQCGTEQECTGTERSAGKCHTCCCIEKGLAAASCNETLEDGSGLGSLSRLPSFSCRANIDRWYHNTKTGRCEQFSWGGCKRNNNHFPCKEMCEKKCRA